MAPRHIVAEALDTPRLSLRDLARRIGTTPHSLKKYRLLPAPGRHTVAMPTALRLRLALFLEEHARGLLALAEQLRRENGHDNGRPK